MPTRKRTNGRLLAGGAAAALLATMLVPVLTKTRALADPAPRPIPQPAHVVITDAGFDPPALTVAEGQTVIFENHSASSQTVAEAKGLFDSGAIPPGGGYAMSVPTAGLYPYASASLPDTAKALLVVGALELDGAPTDPVHGHLPDLVIPPSTTHDMDIHPRWGIGASRTRALVHFAPGATIADADRALANAGVTIIGTVPSVDVAVVEIPDTPRGDFGPLTTALASLRADPAIAAAALDTEVGTTQIPQPTIDELQDYAGHGGTPNLNWTFHRVRGSDGTPGGDGGNWGLESARFPEAWNVVDPLRLQSPTAQTVVFDQGFDPTHSDLQNATLDTGLCRTDANGTELCNENPSVPSAVGTSSDPERHGTHTAGTIGATYDNGADGRSVGVSGGNPVVDLTEVPWGGYGGDLDLAASPVASFGVNFQLEERIADETVPGGLYPDLRVVSYSGGSIIFKNQDNDDNKPLQWEQTFRTARCGPGAHDDASNPTEPCTPNNEDTYLAEMDQVGEIALITMQDFSAHNVMMVQAAGNESTDFYVPYDAPADARAPVVLRSSTDTEFAAASDQWDSALPNPVIIVEAVDNNRARAGFSNVGGTISAPGVNIVSTTNHDNYTALSGTSMATPHVAAALGLMFAADPGLSIDDARRALVDWARADTTDGVQPRLDAFASLLSLPGVAKMLVDVNDPSADGNRRVIRDRHGATVLDTTQSKRAPDEIGPFHSEPDGHVDMRDFRRYRDAWLEYCSLGGSDPTCPSTSAITLDGGDNHPKKDLNWDGCVFDFNAVDPHVCPTTEGEYSRFDFNGDGTLARVAAPVPLNPDGSPTTGGATSSLTDLQILQSQWDADATRGEGWSATDLSNLMVSGDLEVHADDFFAAGATDVTVSVDNHSGQSPSDRTISTPGQSAIITVPVLPTGGSIDVHAHATIDDKPVDSPVEHVDLNPGEDVRVDACLAHVDLASSKPTLLADHLDTAKITATVDLCGKADPVNVPVALSVSPSGAASNPTIAPTDGHADPSGRVQATLTSGTDATTATVTASATLSDGTTLTGTLDIPILPIVHLYYRWVETLSDWHEQGSTVWANAPPDMPDCTSPQVAVDSCISNYHVDWKPNGVGGPGSAVVAARVGHVDETSQGPLLTEQAQSQGASHQSWALSPPADPSQVRNGQADASWALAANQANKLNGFRLSKVKFDRLGPTVSVSGLSEIGELGYVYDLDQTVSGTEYPSVLHAVTPWLALVPRGDGSAFQYAPDTTRAIRTAAINATTYQPYTYCGTIDRDLSTTFGYKVGSQSLYFNGATDLNRKTTFSPGDLPMPVGPGHFTAHVALAAQVVVGNDAPNIDLPDCSTPHPPAPDFVSEKPAPYYEGRPVHFIDRSTDPDGDIASWAWDFGDGTTSAERDPYHVFPDNGTYTVSLTVTDTTGTSSSISYGVTVRNLPPEAQLDDAVVTAGKDFTLSLRATDPSKIDKLALQYSLASDNPDWGSPITTSGPGGAFSLTVAALPVGTYPLALTVTDKDHASGVATATLEVVADASDVVPPPEPPPVTEPPAPDCPAGVTIGGEEAKFLVNLNAYRAAAGLGPISISPTLTVAAVAHNQDMADNHFFDHPGSDGSSPLDRALKAGFGGTHVGENLLKGTASADDAIFAWRQSTPHNANLLDPSFVAIGIARMNSADGWLWTTDFGDAADCPPGIAPAGGARLRATSTRSASSATATPPLTVGGPLAMKRSSSTTTASTERLQTAHVRNADAPASGFVPGIVVSDLTPHTGEPLTVFNASRRDGGALAARVDFGDGRLPVDVAAAGGVQGSFLDPGTYTLMLTTGDVTGSASVSLDLPVTGNGQAPQVVYLGPTTAAREATAHLRAKVTTPTGDPVASRAVTFTVETVTTSAITGSDGVADATAVLDLQPGAHGVSVDVAAVGSSPAAHTIGALTVMNNDAPVARAGGPYAVLVGDPVDLDASASHDVNAGDTLSYNWDLNGDGTFGDATGVNPHLDGAQVANLVCGGTCAPGTSYSIAVQVIDNHGAVSTDTTTLTFTRDFALTVNPSSQSIAPGSYNQFFVTVFSTSGFTEPVTLSAPDLPAGYTASFSPTTLTPGAGGTASAIMTLSVPADATADDLAFAVRGTSGSIVHDTGSTVGVVIGLIPVCYATFDVHVTDSESGAPIPNMVVTSQNRFIGYTDADGRVHNDQIALGNQNQPLSYHVRTVSGQYHEAATDITALCGVTTSIELRPVPNHYGAIAGHVMEGVPDPHDHSPSRKVTPTNTPIAASVIFKGPTQTYTTSDATTGQYTSPQLALGGNNDPTAYQVTVQAPGYDTETTFATVRDGVTTPLDIALVKQCYATVIARVTDDTTHLPAVNALVTFPYTYNPISGQPLYAMTDAEGVATFDDNVPLGPRQSDVDRQIAANAPSDAAPGSYGSNGTVRPSGCDSTLATNLTIHQPVRYTGALSGQVLDDATGAPLAGVNVNVATGTQTPFGISYITVATATTGADGRYSVTDLLVGFDQTTTQRYVSISKDGYWYDGRVQVALTANQTTEYDTRLVPIHTTSIDGTVRDAITGQGIAGAQVCCDNGHAKIVADANGHYHSDDWPLGFHNAKSNQGVDATADGYWENSVTASFSDGVTTHVDIPLVKECDAASVSGIVVNAATHDPIENAQVSGDGLNAYTDAAGHFTLAPLDLGYDNTPFQTTLTASKQGFITANKTVTVFCGAHLVVDFGKDSTTTGAVFGTVKNAATGAPVAGVFVGGEFGGSATTDANGNYRITGVPLGDNAAPRTWSLTAIPSIDSGLGSASGTVTVTSGADAILNFSLGAATATTTTTTTTRSASTTTTSTTTSTTTTTVPRSSTTTTTTGPGSSTTTTASTTSTTRSTSTTTTTSTTTPTSTVPRSSTTTTATTSTTLPPSTTSSSTTSSTVAEQGSTTSSTSPASTSSTVASQTVGSTTPTGTGGLPFTGDASRALVVFALASVVSGALLARRRRSAHR